MQNYIPDLNRFHLAGPPLWWLNKLWEFDSSLVVIPSRQMFAYRLAQRRRLKLSEQVANDILFKESDTQMLASYGLVPVTTILSTANWSNPFLFQELANRAPHRLGGADKAIALVEAQEREEELKQAAMLDDYKTHLAKDAWGMYLKKIGLRTNMWSPKTSQPTSVSGVAPAVHMTRSPARP